MPRKPGYVYAGRNAFLALLPQLCEGLADGRSKRSLYEEYKDRLGVSYVQFTLYCKRYREKLGEGEPTPPSQARMPQKQPSVGSRHQREPIVLGDEPVKTFHFDPMDAYRKKYD